MRRLAIFAHYDAQGEIKPYVRFHLRALRAQCARLSFVTTAKLAASTLAGLDGLCDEVAVRENVGFDFAMWQHVLLRTPITELDELLLVNSSVFGPLGPLGRVFDRMAGEDCDFWGITESYDLHWHLQSYFLLFRRPVLTSAAFARFWSGLFPYRDKWQTTMSHELGLSQALVETGLRGRALVPSASLFPQGPLQHLYRHRRTDLTVYHPLRLLRTGAPFVKVSLLRDNPVGVRLAGVLREMVRLGYERDLIAFDRPIGARGLRLSPDPGSVSAAHDNRDVPKLQRSSGACAQ